MTLRARLLAALAAVLVVLLTAGVTTVFVQRSYLVGQLDEQLEATVPNARLTVNRVRVGMDLRRGPGSAGDLVPAIADAYIGVLDTDGVLYTVVAPNDDPNLVPELGGRRSYRQPATVPTVSGDAARVRVVTADLGPARSTLQLVVALPTTRAEAALRSLVLTLALAYAAVAVVLGLVVWWVIRLGLRPIRHMTEAADAITAGATDTRVPVEPGEHEAARLGRALNLMIDTSQAAESRLRRFVADASHELRTPLTTLRGYTELSAAGALDTPEERADVMRRIGQEATRMSRMVDDLLLLAQLDEERPMERSQVDIAALVHDLAADMRVVQPARSVEVDAAGPLTVLADRDRVVQAITAYTTNAMRHTPPDAPVVLRARREGSEVRVAVEDSGPGIPPDAVDHVFERFYRVDKGRARSMGGNGLGLAIVASIVEAHGGRCGVDSRLGEGSTFWLTLPVMPPPHR